MSPTDSTFSRFAAAVADFGSPFYEEERRRDVWNEASAFGFQLLLWSLLFLGGLMGWAGGAPMFGWALAVVLLAGLSSALVLTYARSLQVEVDASSWPRGRRLVAFAALYVFAVTGLLHASADTSTGFLIGVGVGIVLAVAAVVRQQRRAKDADRPERPGV